MTTSNELAARVSGSDPERLRKLIQLGMNELNRLIREAELDVMRNQQFRPAGSDFERSKRNRAVEDRLKELRESLHVGSALTIFMTAEVNRGLLRDWIGNCIKANWKGEASNDEATA